MNVKIAVTIKHTRYIRTGHFDMHGAGMVSQNFVYVTVFISMSRKYC